MSETTTDQTTPTTAPDRSGPGRAGTAYLLGDTQVALDDPGAAEQLEAAYRSRTRLHCTCTTARPPMYLARAGGRLIAKRMPGTGHLHAPGCETYAPPEELSGLGHVAGQAITHDPKTGLDVLRLGVRLSAREGRAPEPAAPGSEDAGAVAATRKRLTLRGLLHYLWDEAGLSTWSPRMERKRHWGVVSYHLGQAARSAQVKSAPLTDRLYIPPPWTPEKKATLAAQRTIAWAGATARPGRAQTFMVAIGEVKAIEPSRFGHRVTLKHMPDAALFIDEKMHSRLRKAFAAELELWEADENGHLLAIATFGVGKGGSATVEEMALMMTDRRWLPYDTPLTRTLHDIAASEHRRFRVSLRYNLNADVTLPVLVLTDTTPATAVYIDTPPEETPPEVSVWTWDTDQPLTLPRNGRPGSGVPAGYRHGAPETVGDGDRLVDRPGLVTDSGADDDFEPRRES